MSKKISRSNIIISSALIVSIILAAIGMIYKADTLISIWVPVGISLAFACATLLPGLRIWGRVCSDSGKWVAGVLHTFVAGSIIFFLLLFVNYKGADFAKGEKMEATVENKYTKEHTSGGGRRHRNRSSYTTWHIRLRLPDGRAVTYEISRESYYRLRYGSKISVNVARGTFAWEVMKFDK